jgi:hypothetical protein
MNRPDTRYRPHKPLTRAALLLGASALLLAPSSALADPDTSASETVPGFTSPADAAPRSIWQVQTTVNPDEAGLDNSDLDGVSASGPEEAWAVGRFSDEEAHEHPLAEHWNGKTWTQVSVPEPAKEQGGDLAAVDDLGPSDAWAVGTIAGLTLIEHWNGTSWKIVSSPNPATGTPGDDDELDAIAGTGPEDLWAAGSDTNEHTGAIELLFEHWNGKTWTAAPSPTTGEEFEFASAITVIGPDDAWAVGSNKTDGSDTLSAHWNGESWSIVPTPEFTDKGGAHNELTGVSADGPDDLWASGFADSVNGENLAVPYLLHWNGTSWTFTKIKNKGTEGSRLNDVQVLSPTNAWAVGQTQELNGSILSLTEQFNGSSWKIVKSPDPGKQGKLLDNSLRSVTSAGGGDLFAVGTRERTGQCCDRTLAIATTLGGEA